MSLMIPTVPSAGEGKVGNWRIVSPYCMLSASYERLAFLSFNLYRLTMMLLSMSESKVGMPSFPLTRPGDLEDEVW